MDVISYSLSKKIAASAVSGVQSMSVSGQTLTINTKDSGVLTMTFPVPKDGLSVTDIDVNANNQIVFTMSDGTEIISGKIPTVKGDKGDPFKYSDFTQEQLDSLKGSDGFSPTATVEKVGKAATITITDKNGTTTATIKDGEGSEGGEANVIDSISVNGVNVSPDENKNVDITVPTKTSDLSNNSGFLTEHQDISGKVDKVDGKSLIADSEIERLASVDNYDDTEVKSQIQAVANGLMDSVGYSADYKSIDIIAKNGVKKSVNVAPIISHASITELSDVDTTNKATGKALVYNATTSKHEYADVSGTDEKVKMDASTDAKYLGELLDNVTIANENGELKVKKLDGQEVTITEINYLKGLTMNVMDLVNMFSNGGVKIINTPVATYAELLTLDKSAFIEGISYLVYVLTDENHDNAKTTYLVDKDSETPTYFGFADSQRDFTTNPIDLATEITGKLGIANMDSDAIKALFTVDDTYKTETATNNAFSTHGAKALYDELLLAIGNKANNSDLTAHKDDTDIHVSTTEKNSWNGKADASDLTAHTDDADIHVTTDDKTLWNTVEDKVDKTSIVTALDDTVTDEQVASALLAKTELDKISSAQKEAVAKVNESLAYNASKNMLYANVGTINGVTITSKDKSTALLNGTNTSNVSVFETADVIPSGEYHIKVSNRVGALYVWDLTHSKTIIEVDNTECNFTLTEPSKLVVGFSIGSGTSFTNFEVSGQLEKGTVATDFVPYNGKSNLELTNDVVSLKNDLNTLEFGEVAGGKNLLDIEEKIYSNSVTDEKTSFIATLKVNNTWAGAVNVTGNGIFSITFDITDSNINNIKLYHSGSHVDITLIYKDIYLDVGKYTMSFDAIGCNPQVVNGIKIQKIQIEKGTTATEYEPYIQSVKMLSEGNTHQSNEIMDIKMLGWTVPIECPIQNYVDSDGVFHQRVGRVDLGSLSWTYDTLWKATSGVSNIKIFTVNMYHSVYVPTIANVSDMPTNSVKKADSGTLWINNGSSTEKPSGYLYFELATEKTIKVDGNEAVTKVNDSLDVIGKCKNLLNPTLQTTTMNNVTCTDNGDGTYTLNGTASSDIVLELESYKPYTGNEIFRLVGCPSGGSASTYYLGFRPNNAEENRKDIGSGVTFNDLSTSNKYAVAIIVLNGTTVTNLTFKPMLTTNLNATYDDFVPYTGDGETLTHDVAELKNDLSVKKFELVAGALWLCVSGKHCVLTLNGYNLTETTYFDKLKEYQPYLVARNVVSKGDGVCIAAVDPNGNINASDLVVGTQLTGQLFGEISWIANI